MMLRRLSLSALGACTSWACAFTVEAPAAASVVQRGAIVVVAYGSDYFSVVALPTQAAQLEFHAVLPAAYTQGLTTPLNPGSAVSPDQVPIVLEAYFNDSAIDAASIRVRNLQIKERGYAAWCSSPTIFGCLNRELRAGTWVEFEVNGRNRQGGMTGYQPRIFMIRRIPMASQAPGPTSPSAVAQELPANLPHDPPATSIEE